MTDATYLPVSGQMFSDAKKTRRESVKAGNSTPQSFKTLFGDLMGNIFFGDLSLEGLNLSSLHGAPYSVVNGNLSVVDNPELKEFIPISVGANLNLLVDHTLLLNILKSYKSKNNKDIPTIKCYSSNFSKAEFEDLLIDIAYNYHDHSLLLSRVEFVGLYNESSATPTTKVMELYNENNFKKISSVYKKVDLDKEKLKRTLELL